MKHTKIGTAGLLCVGAIFNIACQNDAQFFESMRKKYFEDLPDDKIVNFDLESKMMVAQKYRLAGQQFYELSPQE